MVPPEVFVTKHLAMIEYKKDLQPNYCCPQKPGCSFLDVCKYASAESRAEDCIKGRETLKLHTIKMWRLSMLHLTSIIFVIPTKYISKNFLIILYDDVWCIMAILIFQDFGNLFEKHFNLTYIKKSPSLYSLGHIQHINFKFFIFAISQHLINRFLYAWEIKFPIYQAAPNSFLGKTDN